MYPADGLQQVEKLEDMQKQMIESVEKKVAIMVDGLAQNNIQAGP